MVLISTYWNVNVKIGDIGTTADAVLISTYWNVNVRNKNEQSHFDTRFNLNLLECKYCECAVLLRPTQSFNLNLLECK